MLQFTKTDRFNEVMSMIRTEGLPAAEQTMFAAAAALGRAFDAGKPFPVVSSPLLEKGGSRAQLIARYNKDDNGIVVFYKGIPLVKTFAHKALFVNELGSGDAVTRIFQCANYEEVYAIKPPQDRAGDTPFVYYKDGDAWKVATYQDAARNGEYQGWRDMDVIYNAE